MTAFNPGKRKSTTYDVIEFGGVAAILHPRHCEERKRRSNPFLRLRRDGLLRACRGRRLRSGYSSHQGEPLVTTLVRGDDARRRRGRDARNCRVRRAPAVVGPYAGAVPGCGSVRESPFVSAYADDLDPSI